MSDTGVLQKSQAERSNRVVTAAVDLARDGGYDAVQMRALAERSGVAVGTIYRYFGSKDDVLLSAMAAWIRLLDARIRAKGFPGETVADRVSGVLHACARSTDRERRLMGALLRSMSSSQSEQADHRAEIAMLVNNLVVDAIDGEQGVDVEGVSRVIGNVWYAVTMSWVAGHRPTGYVGTELERTARLLLERR